MSNAVRSFRDLDAWRIGMDLAESCYRVVRRLPADERYGLGSQIRRAAVSVPANVAEGHSYGADRVFRRHVRVALGSVGELMTLLEVSVRVGALTKEDVDEVFQHLTRTAQVLQGLKRAIQISLLKKAGTTCAAVAACLGLMRLL